MTKELWHPEIEVNDELVKYCIETQFSELSSIESLKCIGSGWDNKVFLIDDRYVFRFPHRQISVPLIERENTVLAYLQDKLELKIPNPIFRGKPSSSYPAPFHGYQMVAGKPAHLAKLTEPQRVASIAKLARFLKALHSIDEAEALSIGAKPQIFDRTDITSTTAQLNERIEKIVARDICKLNHNCIKNELAIAENIKLPADGKVLLHGDLYFRHLMFDQSQLSAVIDWGDTGINNRSVDLAAIFSFYPSNCYQSFLDIYGEVEEQTWQYARFLGLYSAITIMLYGYDVGDNSIVNEAINSVKRINPELI